MEQENFIVSLKFSMSALKATELSLSEKEAAILTQMDEAMDLYEAVNGGNSMPPNEFDVLVDSIPGAEEVLTKQRKLWEVNEVKIRNNSRSC